MDTKWHIRSFFVFWGEGDGNVIWWSWLPDRLAGSQHHLPWLVIKPPFHDIFVDRPRTSSPFHPLRSHNFRWFRTPSLECVKTQTYVPFVVFWIRAAWSSLEQGKKLQHFLLDRVAKFTSFVTWTGSGFRWVGRTPYPNSCWVPPGDQLRADRRQNWASRLTVTVSKLDTIVVNIFNI